MSDKLKASLPGIFTCFALMIFLATQLITKLPFDVYNVSRLIMVAIAAWLGLAWIPPLLQAQIGDQSLKGNLGPLFTLLVVGFSVGDALSTKITPAVPEMIADGLLLISTWLGLPWTKPQLPSQAPMLLLLFMAGALIIIGPTGFLILLA